MTGRPTEGRPASASPHTLAELPEWEAGTVAVLSTGAGPPHAIPVSTAVRAGPSAVLLALALRRESLARLRTEPAVALTLLATDVACTALGRATVVREPMQCSDGVAAVLVEVGVIQDHRQPRFAMESGIAWRWTDDEAQARDAEIRAELRALAQARSGR
ncbi:MAG: hypothetical protein JWQ20_2756 [Conexibacter sp.]|nr:hypothetical protein [Conexibacter sp.]